MKKMLFLIVLLLTILTPDLKAQWQWAKQAGGTLDETAGQIAIDGDGNQYVTGTFYGTATFGTITLTHLEDWVNIFIAKLDPNGNYLWVKQVGGYNNIAPSIAVDLQGNVYLAGGFGAATFGTTSLITSGGNDVFIAKMDNDGNFLWAKKAGGIQDDKALSLAVDAAGNAYLTGYYTNEATFGSVTLTNSYVTPGYHEIFICKIDANGTFVWAKKAGGSESDTGYYIALDAQNDIYVSGIYQTIAAFGALSLTSTNGAYSDIFVVKMDNDGNFIWAQTAGSAGEDACSGMAVDALGNQYLLTSFGSYLNEGNIQFGTTITHVGGIGSFIAKLDPNGVFVWAKQNDNNTRSINIDYQGNLHFLGIFVGTAAFDSITLTSIDGDYYIAKMDPDSNYIRANKIDGKVAINAVGIDNNENYYCTGAFTDSAMFYPTTLFSYGYNDVYIAKFNHNFIDTGILDLAIENNEVMIDNYPNPFNNFTTFGYNLERSQWVKLIIYNAQGKRIKELLNCRQDAGRHIADFDASSLSNGVYFYKFESNGGTQVKKMILVK